MSFGEIKEAFCLVLNRNKDPFTNWRHAFGIINKVDSHNKVLEKMQSSTSSESKNVLAQKLRFLFVKALSILDSKLLRLRFIFIEAWKRIL